MVAHCQRLLPQLKNESLFLTGGTGFFGIWLLEGLQAVQQAADLNLKVTVLTRKPEAFQQKVPHLANHPMVRLWQGDVKTFSFPVGPFTAVIHGATDTVAGKEASASLARLDTIISGTRRTLEFAQAQGARRFLNISSGAVYGRQPPELTRVPETYLGGPDPLNAGAGYAEGKRVAEHLGCLYASAALSVTTARCFAFHGPHLPLDQHFAVGNFLRDVLLQRPIQIQGDGTPRRSYLYAADTVIWLLYLLYKGRSGVAYNVGSDQDLSIFELAQQTAATLKCNSPVHIAKKAVPGILPERYIPDVSRARQELGLEVWTPFTEQVSRAAEWVRRAGITKPIN
jgi:dTDP-glucose 4,6-dehydratase